MSKKEEKKLAEEIKAVADRLASEGTTPEEAPEQEESNGEGVSDEKHQEGKVSDVTTPVSASKKKYVKYYLPLLPGKSIGDSQTVTINGVNYQVRYGEEVEVPVGVRDVLEEMVKQSMLIEKKIKALQEEKCISKIE